MDQARVNQKQTGVDDETAAVLTAIWNWEIPDESQVAQEARRWMWLALSNGFVEASGFRVMSIALGHLEQRVNELTKELAELKSGRLELPEGGELARVSYGGMVFDIDPDQAKELLRRVNKATQSGEAEFVVVSGFSEDRAVLIGPGIPISVLLPATGEEGTLDDA